MKQHYPLKNAQQEKRIFRNRIFFRWGVVVFFLLLLVARYAFLQISGYDEFATASIKTEFGYNHSHLHVVIFMTAMVCYWQITTLCSQPL